MIFDLLSVAYWMLNRVDDVPMSGFMMRRFALMRGHPHAGIKVLLYILLPFLVSVLRYSAGQRHGCEVQSPRMSMLISKTLAQVRRYLMSTLEDPSFLLRS